MICKKTYRINNWKSWDDEINAAVKIFHDRFSIYPNILLANHVTYSRINLIADKNNVTHKDEDRKPDKYEYADINSFVNEYRGYELEFCIDEKLPDMYFSLIYDSDPGGDEEPVPEEDTDYSGIAKEKAA